MTASSPRPEPRSETVLVRLHRALGPLAGGIILDFVDLATFGPLGIYGGFVLGGLVGWWVTSLYGLSRAARVGFALLAMAYTAVPMTGPLPLATLISAFARFKPQLPPAPVNDSAAADEPSGS